MSELKLEGDKEFTKPPAELYPSLTNPQFLVECIPDVDNVETVTEDSATFTVRPGFSFVRGTLNTVLRIVDKTEPTEVKMTLESTGIGSSSTVEASLTLAANDTGTSAHWVAEVTKLGGLLKLAPKGLLKGAAQQVLADLWDRVEAKLNEAEA